MRILHLTHHWGCHRVIKSVVKSFGFELQTQNMQGTNFNIGHQRANELWEENRDYYNQFDVIVVSDTAPLSRIFLQNEYRGKLIIWIDNRFDYCDSMTNDCLFPDREYYDLFRSATQKKNVKIISSSDFETFYAAARGVSIGDNVIRPWCFDVYTGAEFPIQRRGELPVLKKENLFLIPPYHNNNLFDLLEKCRTLGVPAHHGLYDGPEDLIGFKGLIHIPNGWSDLSPYECWEKGLVYLIPSVDFELILSAQPGFWFQEHRMLRSAIEKSCWFCPENYALSLHFDSWDHLGELAKNNDLLESKRRLIQSIAPTRIYHTLKKWYSAFTEW